MRPRLALLLGALVVPALPLLTAAPAQAVIGTICVGPVPAGTVCNDSRGTIPLAIAAATSGDLIWVGSGTYSDGPYTLGPGVSLRGSGAGVSAAATALTLPAGAQTYVTVNQGTVSHLRVSMTTGNGATGVAASGGAIVESIVVFGAGSTSSTGVRAQASTLQDVTVNVTGGSGNVGIRSTGGNTIADSTWNGGLHTYRLNGGSDTISRVTVNPSVVGVEVQEGTLAVDDSVIDLGSEGVSGLVALPSGSATSAVAHVNHLTIVRGKPGSRGVVADASTPAMPRTATITLNNSVVWGPTNSLGVNAGSDGGTASLTVSRSDYQTLTPGVTDGGGNLVGADPAFINGAAGDFDLRANSPVIDKGVATSASKDRAGRDRSVDGDRNGVAVPDMGAYELNDVTPPRTVITDGPSGQTNDNTPVFTFRSGADVTFQCQIDGSGFQPCSSPVTTTPLANGPHLFTVRGADPVFNVESSPPTRNFTVDTVAPDTRFTKKAPKRFFKKKVKFKFASSEAGARFQCKLDGRPWRSCASTFKFGVKRGKHVILVRSVDKAGNTDKTPARYKFKRLKRR